MKYLKEKFIPIGGLSIIGVLIIIWGFHWKPQGPVLYLIGDSTMANKPGTVQENPERGWGQALQQYFEAEVRISNHAVNGRSTKSFIEEGRWQKVLDSLQAGDFVLIQFGHNDQKLKDPKRFTNPTGAYLHNLKQFIKDTREKKATPVLLTSIVRRKFNEFGTLTDTHGLYPLIVRQVAQEEEVLLIDHLYLTEKIVQEWGVERSKELYVWVEPGNYAKFPEGKKDDTHLSKKGADLYAKVVAEQLSILDTPLKYFSLLK